MKLLLYKHLINYPDELQPTCYYVIDNCLKWVLFKNSDSLYFLYSIMNDTIDECLMSTDSFNTVDTYAFTKWSPLIMSCTWKLLNDNNTHIREVTLKTGINSTIPTKPKPSKNINIINHTPNKTKKLF